MKQRKYIDS